MAALTDLSDVINRVTGGNSGTPESIFFFKEPRVAGAAAVSTIAGQPQSLWQYEMTPGGAGALPGGTARNPTNATAGSLFQTDPGGGRTKWCLGMSAAVNTTGMLEVVDRLADISGLSGVTTTAQSITGLSVTRYTGTASVGNQIRLEIGTIIGTTPTSVTASYTNQAGTAGRTTKLTVIGGTGFREVGRCLIMPLQDGDTGVRSVEDIDLLASTGTAGDIVVSIVRPLILAPCVDVAVGVVRDLISYVPGVLSIPSGACLALTFLPNSTGAPRLMGFLQFIEA